MDKNKIPKNVLYYKHIFKKNVKKMTPAEWIIFSFYILSSKNIFSISEIEKITGIAKNTIISANITLKKLKLIDYKSEFSEGVKKYKIIISKRVYPKNCALDVPIYINTINNSKDSKNVVDSITSLDSKNVIESKSLKRRRSNKTHDFIKIILNELSKHPRYNNDYYRKLFNNKLNYLSNKEKSNVKLLISLLEKKDIANYISWWIEKKSKSFSGVNFGLLLCCWEDYKKFRGEKTVGEESERKAIMDEHQRKVLELKEEVKRKYKRNAKIVD